jgi:hypothetical protein
MSYVFEKHTEHFFIPSAKFAAVATSDEIDACRVWPVVNSVDVNKVFRKKADAKRFTDAGFTLEYVTKTQFVIKDQAIGTIGSRTIGPMIVIDYVEDKYNDNNGAYQVAHGRDAEGNELSESNMYAPGAFFTVGPIDTNSICIA